jgi:hypothetical protein
MAQVQIWLACLALVAKARGLQGAPAAAAALVAAPAVDALVERWGVCVGLASASGCRVGHLRFRNSSGNWGQCMLDHLYQYTLDAGAKVCAEASQRCGMVLRKKAGCFGCRHSTAQPAAERGGKQQGWMTVGNWTHHEMMKHEIYI